LIHIMTFGFRFFVYFNITLRCAGDNRVKSKECGRIGINRKWR
jgi:hypothetical protein